LGVGARRKPWPKIIAWHPDRHTKRARPSALSSNPLERLNAEIKRRSNVVGIFPNDASVARLVGPMLLVQSDEWSLNRP
jgi:transposase-like protein